MIHFFYLYYNYCCRLGVSTLFQYTEYSIVKFLQNLIITWYLYLWSDNEGVVLHYGIITHFYSLISFTHFEPFFFQKLFEGTLLIPLFTKPVWGLVWSQCLLLNQFFMLWQPENRLWTRKAGFTVAPTLGWSRTKNQQWLGTGLFTTNKTNQNFVTTI